MVVVDKNNAFESMFGVKMYSYQAMLSNWLRLEVITTKVGIKSESRFCESKANII